MRISENIFNEIVNISSRIEHLESLDVPQNSLIDIQDKYNEVYTKIARRETDDDDFESSVKKLEQNEDHEDAVSDAEIDCVNDVFGDGATQLKFIPDGSVLMQALRGYFDHVSGGLATPKYIAHHYIRSGVDSSELDNGGPLGNGIYYATGLGYYTNDDLFLGVPIKHRAKPVDGGGSGVPSKRFLEYVNSHN